MIPQQFIEEVQSRTDIVEVISSYIPLKRTGRNFKGLCPFHGEKTPSFIVSSQKQIFHCFGCGEGGGSFQFLSLIEKINFPEAVELLAKRLGLTVPSSAGEAASKKSIFYDVVDEAANFFHNSLKTNQYCKPILQYLKQRGMADKTINTFRLGASLPGNALMEYLRKKKFKLDTLEKASLITAKNQGFRDLFSDRIMFPIFDVRSRPIAFGGRSWKDDNRGPKYMNSIESILYHKREHLYGLNLAKEFISQNQEVIITEGYLDVITPYMRGVRNIVASLGTALTIEQIRLLKRYTQSVILVFDSDKAGQSATLRTIDLLLENDVRVYIAKLPAGYDPDSLVREKGIDDFTERLDKRVDFFDYKLYLLKQSYDLNTIEGKTKIAQGLLETIDKLQSEIKKYEYIKRCSNELDIKEEILIAEFRKKFSKSKNKQRRNFSSDDALDVKKEIQKIGPIPITEKIILKFMFTNQKAFSIVKENLKDSDFSVFLVKKVINFFLSNHKPDSSRSIAENLANVSDTQISGFVSMILMDEDIPMDKSNFKQSLLKIKKKQDLTFKSRLKDKIKEAETRGDRETVIQLINQYSKINGSD